MPLVKKCVYIKNLQLVFSTVCKKKSTTTTNLRVANVLEALHANPVANPQSVELAVIILHGGCIEMDSVRRDRLDVFHVHVAEAVASWRNFLALPLQPSTEGQLFAHGGIQCKLEHLCKPGIRGVQVVPVHGCNGLSGVLDDDDPVAPAKGEHARILVARVHNDGDGEEQQYTEYQVSCHLPAVHAPYAVL